MSKIKNTILGSYSTFNSVSYSIMPQSYLSTTSNAAAYNIQVDDGTQINMLKQSIQFKNELIALDLVNNKALLNCLTETVNMLSTAGILFYADLDLIEDDHETKFLLVYYPINKPLNSYLTSFENKPNDQFDRLYSSVIRNLYKYPISIKKNVIIDEQPI